MLYWVFVCVSVCGRDMRDFVCMCVCDGYGMHFEESVIVCV